MSDSVDISRRRLSKAISATLSVGAIAPVSALARTVTPAQVEGPFHPDWEQQDTDIDMTRVTGQADVAQGEHILVSGTVMDRQGNPLANAEVDVWQANHFGRYAHPGDRNTAPTDPGFQGWALMSTNAQGEYQYRTIKPAPYPLSFLGETGMRCRHIHYKVACKGYTAVTTQMYFEGDPLIEQDLEIAKIAPEHQHLLIAKASRDDQSGLLHYRFDITLE